MDETNNQEVLQVSARKEPTKKYSISLSKPIMDRLYAMKRLGDTYDFLLTNLLDNYDKHKDQN